MADEHYDYINGTGVIVPQTSETLDAVRSDWRAVFGQDFSVEPSTPQGRIIELIAASRIFALGACALVANQINIDLASGQFLDSIGLLFGLTRNAATRTRVFVALGGIPGTVIPAGSIAKTADGDAFYLENDAAIGTGGSVNAYFLSSETGPIPAAAGSLAKIVSQVLGWETITNGAAGELGADAESDYDFRIRIKDSRYQGVSLVGDIKSALNAVPNIKSSYIYNNGSNQTVQYDGVSINPHSVLIVVEGGEDHAVAEAIFSKLSGGCGLTAIAGQSVNESVVDGSYGTSYPIIFNRPEAVPVSVEISVRNDGFSGEDIATSVKDAIVNWANWQAEGLDGVSIGDPVSPFGIASVVSRQIPTLYVSNVLIAKQEDTPAAQEIDFTIAEIASFSADDITVNILD